MLDKKALADFKAIMILHAVSQMDGKRKAAKELDISVDTISKYIDTLEYECGGKLLNSTGGGSVLTVRGERMADWSRLLHKELNHMYIMLSEKNEVKGEVKILWDRNARANVINKEFWNCLKKNKELSLVSTVVNSLSEVKSSNYDLIVSYNLPNSDDWELIYSKKTVGGYFASAQYLKKYGYPKSKEDMLQKHRMIFLRKEFSWIKGIEKDMAEATHKVYLSDSSFATNEAIENNVGIGIMPLSFVKKGFVCLDNIKTDASGTVYLLTHKESKDTQRVKVLTEYLKSMLDKA